MYLRELERTYLDHEGQHYSAKADAEVFGDDGEKQGTMYAYFPNIVADKGGNMVVKANAPNPRSHKNRAQRRAENRRSK